MNWMESHEAAVATFAGGLGTLLANHLGTTGTDELAAIGLTVAAAAHLVHKVVEAFVKGLGKS